MSKRILHVIPTLDRTGAAKQMGLLAAGLPRDEFDVHVCALAQGGPHEDELRQAGVPTAVIGQRWSFDPQTVWRLTGHVARLRPDLIHTWSFDAHAYGQAAGRWCGVRRTIMELQSVDPWQLGLRQCFNLSVARRARCIVVRNDGGRNFLVRHRVPSENICVISNGVAVPDPPQVARRHVLDELGLPEDVRLVGLVGPLCLHKRVKDAIWAADLLKVIRDDVHLLIIGDGPHADRLRRFRDQVQIRDRVHFLGHRGDLLRWLPFFDLFWSTSEHEGQSNAILEAMAAGVPVVATDIPGTRDLVISGTTGYLVPVGDRAALARCSERLLNNPALAAQFAAAARQRAANEFNTQKMIDRHAELYRKVLGWLC